MKTYIISLKRSVERRDYIKKHVENLELNFEIVDAVDGSTFSQENLIEFCDMDAVSMNRHWLSNGAIACSLSHLKVYERFLKSDDRSCFIVEDDVILPLNIKNILADIANEVLEDEVILLYYTSFYKCLFSIRNAVKVDSAQLLYPMDVTHPITAAAYVVGKQAARQLANSILPVKVSADCWSHFYDQKCFKSFRVLYPSPIRVKNFKSTIDYLEKNSWLGKLSNTIQEKKIPIFFQIMRLIRKIRVLLMSSRFYLVDETSPIDENLN